MSETKINTVKINRLSQQQYDKAKQDGELHEKEIYITPGDKAPGIFIGEYGVTTLQEVVNEYNRGKKIYCKYINDTNIILLSLSHNTENQTFDFSCTYLSNIYETKLNIYGWTEVNIYPLLLKSNYNIIRENAMFGKSASDKLDYLIPYIKGQEWIFDTEEYVASVETIPNGAKMASIESFGGQTIMWNQLVPLTNKTNTGGTTSWVWDTTIKKFHIQGTPTGDYSTFNLITPVSNHKYYIYSDCDTPPKLKFANAQPNVAKAGSFIFSCSSATAGYFGLVGLTPNVEISIDILILVFDLTVMFGEGNEPLSTSDERIIWINNYIKDPSHIVRVPLSSAQKVFFPVETIQVGNSIATIPSSVTALSGYGHGIKDLSNTVERTDIGWQYVQRVDDNQSGVLPTALSTPVITDITNEMQNVPLVQPVSSSTEITFGNSNTTKSFVQSTIKYAIHIEETL